jgi:hypothetical protein
MAGADLREVCPSATTAGILRGAQFADAYCMTITSTMRDARMAAELTIGRSPGWVQMLLALRDAAVLPFGLKTATAQPARNADVIGIFPVLSESADRLVAGLDDRHLDFRVVIDLAGSFECGQEVTVTTLVRTHNRLGRLYLATIMPFHRMIARAMLRQLA